MTSLRFGDLVQAIGELDPNLLICAHQARPLTQESPVTLVKDGDPVPPGFKYLLEVFLAKEVLEAWSAHRQGLDPNAEEAVEAITYYGDRDAYLLPDADSGDASADLVDTPDLPDRVQSIQQAMHEYLNRRPVE